MLTEEGVSRVQGSNYQAMTHLGVVVPVDDNDDNNNNSVNLRGRTRMEKSNVGKEQTIALLTQPGG